MIIREVEIFGVGPLAEKRIELQPQDINLILGPNESGKTTLFKSIISVIYGFSNQKEAKLSRSRQETDQFQGKVLVDIGDISYEVSRDFSSSAVTITKHEIGSDPEIIFDGKSKASREDQGNLTALNEILHNEIGFPPRSVLSNTAYIGQLDIGIDLDEDLRRQISSVGQSNYKNARKLLEHQYDELSKEPSLGENQPSTSNKVLMLETEIAELELKLKQYVERRNEIDDFRKEHASKKAELQDATKQANKKIDALQALQNYLDTLAEGLNLKQKAKLADSQQELFRKLEKRVIDIEEELISNNHAPLLNLDKHEFDQLKQYIDSDIEGTTTKLDGILREQQRLHEDISNHRFSVLREIPEVTGLKLLRLRKLDTDITKQREKIRIHDNRVKEKPGKSFPIITFSFILLAGFIIGGILGSLYVKFFDPSTSPILGIVIGSGSIGIPIILISMLYERASKDQTTYPIMDKYIVKTDLIELEAERDILISELEHLLPEVDSLEGLIEKLEEFTTLKRKLDSINKIRESIEENVIITSIENTHIRQILDNVPVASLKESIERIEHLCIELETKLETLAELSSTYEAVSEETSKRQKQNQFQLQKIEELYPDFHEYRDNPALGREQLKQESRTIEQLELQTKELNNKIRQAELELAEYQSSNSINPDDMEDLLTEKMGELGQYELLSDALEIALEKLDESITEHEDYQLSGLSTNASHYLNLFTNEHYSDVDLDADPIKVRDNQEQELIISDLSTGTRDQLFLALRLATLDMLSSDLAIPIVMDDSFANFDYERLTTAMDVLSKIAEDRQIILLSHDDRYQNWANNVITI